MSRALLLSLAVLNCAAVPLAEAPVVWRDPSPAAKNKNLLEYLLGEPPAKPCPADGLLKLDDTITDEMSDGLARELAACRGRAVVIEFDSPGGSVFAAIRLQKAIERHDKAVFCVVDGLAASAAFMTLQSCTSRHATDRSVLMAHEASLKAAGQEQEMRNSAAALRAVNWGMAERCAKRMGISHAEFESHVSNGQEWYLSQADGLRHHALDGPAESVDEVVKLAGSER